MKKELLERSAKFIKWKRHLEQNGVSLQEYSILKLITKKDGSVLFAMLDAKMVSDTGEELPNIVFLRGDFVAVLIHLYAIDTKNDYVLLVKQRRVATGGYFYEFPAGMLDEDNDIYQVAIKEVREETGISINKDELILLNEGPFYSSPGVMDEGGYYFAYRIELPEEEIVKLQRKNLGNKNERENIETVVVEINDASKYIENVHGRLHLLLYKSRYT